MRLKLGNQVPTMNPIMNSIKSAVSSNVNRMMQPIARKVENVISDIKRAPETAKNSFVSTKWAQKELISPLPKDQTMGTKEYLTRQSNNFWDQADYKDALQSEIKHTPQKIKQEAQSNGWIPIKDNSRVLGKTVQATPSANEHIQRGPVTIYPTEVKPHILERVAVVAESVKDPILKQKAKQSFPILAKGFLKVGISNPGVIAYGLSTLMQEGGNALDAVEMIAQPGINKRNDAVYRAQQNIDGGINYRGRGAIQLTHAYNYKKYGDILGIDLLNNPDLAADPEISSEIMAVFFKERGVDKAIEEGDLDKARTLIQGRGALSPVFYKDTMNISSRSNEFNRLMR